MRKILAAAASLAAFAGLGAEAALLDLTNRDNNVAKTLTNSTVLSNMNLSGMTDVFDGVPNPQGNNPLVMQVGQLLVRIEGFNDPVNGDQRYKGDCDDDLDTGLTCYIDGIGIGDDEIDVQRSERVEITFHDGTAAGQGQAIEVQLLATYFLDLFYDNAYGSLADAMADDRVESAVAEFYDLSGNLIGTDEVFGSMAKAPTSGFAQGPNALLAGVAKIVFTSGTGKDDNSGDFALAGLDIFTGSNIENTVPVPAALPLFLAGLGGLMAFRRRRSAK
jgi:hypothetical protein